MPSECVTREEVIENLTRNILEDKRAYLCKYLNPCDHFDYLRSKKVLTRDDQEVIKNEPSQSTKAGKMLDILQTKGPEGYEALVLSIQKNKTQTFLVTMLNTEFESRKNAYMSLMEEKSMTTEAELRVDPKSLPTPNKKSGGKLCVESVDTGSITPNKEKDLDQIWIRESYLQCANDSSRENTNMKNCHDKSCIRHDTDA